MEPKTIEGSWEEVSRRADELAGRRVRITVFDDIALPKVANNGAHADDATEPTAFDVLSKAGLIGCLKGGPADLAANPKHMKGFGGGTRHLLQG